MAKRFTDTDIWKKAWFRKLSPRLKEVWRFLIENCNHAGILDLDVDSMSFHIGEKVTENDIYDNFNGKITWLSASKIFIPKFIEFQYGDLNPANRAHKSVINILEKEGAYKGLTSSLQGAKDKDKDKVKDKEKGKSEVEKFENRFAFDFSKLFEGYPRYQKRTESLNLMAENISDQETYDQLKTAIEKYRAHIEREGTDFNMTLTFPNFFKEWRDWLDPKIGTSTGSETSKEDLRREQRMREIRGEA